MTTSLASIIRGSALKIFTPVSREGPSARALAASGIILLHLVCYHLVNEVNRLRPPDQLLNLDSSVDALIPYLGWTGVFYYGGDLYATIWAGVVFWRMPRRLLPATAVAYVGMILLGAATQVLLPARAPWPAAPMAIQRWTHSWSVMQPYACLPSMHVTLTAYPCCVALSVLRTRWVKTLSVVGALLIAISTLTLKEHYVLDTLAGLVLAFLSFTWWRYAVARANAAVDQRGTSIRG